MSTKTLSDEELARAKMLDWLEKAWRHGEVVADDHEGVALLPKKATPAFVQRLRRLALPAGSVLATMVSLVSLVRK